MAAKHFLVKRNKYRIHILSDVFHKYTVLVATHDREMIRRVGRRSITLDHGRLVETS